MLCLNSISPMEIEESKSPSQTEQPTADPHRQSFSHDVRLRNSSSESVNDKGFAEKKKKSSLMLRKKRCSLANGMRQPTTSSASASSSSVGRARGMSMRRNPRFDLGSNSHRRSEVDALALPLGMSFAAVLAQVLDKTEVENPSEYINNLSEMCSSAVKESVDNVFGDKFDTFVGNFQKSFGSTLRTIRLINESSGTKGRSYMSRQKVTRTHCMIEPGTTSENSMNRQSTRYKEDHESEIAPSSDESEDRRDLPRNLISLEHDLHQQTSQDLICFSSIRTSSVIDSSVVSTYKKSVVEQTRANDLKAYEISLLLEKLKLKETKLAIDSESNYLDRFKISMGISKASFKAEKFKTQLEGTRHAELLRSCIDCLVGSLLITSGSLVYGAYIHSYQRITEATALCAPSKTSKSWWVPNTVDAFNSGFKMISCQVQVLSRMMFGVLMILAITYILLQRSAAPGQSMPITFILLILGIACGFFGKLCVDTLGGNGYTWLLYWEALCTIHFMANVFTSSLFTFLYGPIKFDLSIKSSSRFSYLSRRVIVYATTLFILPLACGLIPFASFDEWTNHFLAMASNAFIS